MTKRLLIIDDEQDLREVIQVSLGEFAGWQTLTAASCHDGLLKAQTEPLDAILLDVSMPEVDGFLCFERLRANPATQPIPVVLFTVQASPQDLRRFAAIGVAGVIIKPFKPITLCQQIAEILGWTL